MNVNVDFTGKRVLVADDEEISREVVCELLTAFGLVCESVTDGAQLLSRLNDTSKPMPDIVFSDINMPVMGGIDACSTFRQSAHPQAKTLPILGISTDSDPTIFDRAISAGMNGMTLKPLTAAIVAAHLTLTLTDRGANASFMDHTRRTAVAESEKSQLFRLAGHDFQTPIHQILGFADLLNGEGLTGEAQTWVEGIRTSAKTLKMLVLGMLGSHDKNLAAAHPVHPPVEKKPAGAKDFSRLRVLVVDDSTLNLKVLSTLCRQIGVGHIETAANGVEALAKPKGSFDLILTDLWMPELDGEGYVKALRERGETIPVYAVTADINAPARCADVGFDDILLKPLGRAKLQKVVDSVEPLLRSAS